ncbi:MAG: phosphoribosylglycinamide formyltransferase [Pelagerythrobacter marensis]|nr:MAG: phosphoribosylglycinamide formyltransferase [Pelagerythrobacter marensis]
MQRARVAVFLSGQGNTFAALLYASRLPGAAYEIVLAASNDPTAPGLALAAGEGVPTFALSHRGTDRAAHDAAMSQAAADAGADLIALAGYMRVLGPAFVARWQGRLINIHPSLLPLYPGLDTHARALAAGDSHGGATVHWVTDELDAGEALGQIRVAITAGDTAESLAARVKLAEQQLYPAMLSEIARRPFDAGWLLAQVRARALALPEAEERDSHGAPGFRTGGKSGKFFAYFSDQHHGTPYVSVLCKTSGPDELAALVESDPDVFHRPAYYGASGWVGLILNRPDLDWAQVDYWLARSWRAVAPRRLTTLLDAADAF